MTPGSILLGAALAGCSSALSPPTTCVEIEPRHQVEFVEGSAVIEPGEMARLADMLGHTEHYPGKYRLSGRGYADRAGSFDAKSWRPEDVALADARARVVSDAVRSLLSDCVERVAIGAAPSDAPAARVDEQGRRWRASAVLVLADRDSHDTPIDGVSIESECGPPAPEKQPAPAEAKALKG